MIKSIIFPSRYLQGPKALYELPKFLKLFSGDVLVVLDEGVRSFMEPKLKEICSDNTLHIPSFCGQSTEAEMRKMANIAKEKNVTVILGVGGGKAIDTAKGALFYYPFAKMFAIPTIAASDAPCSKNAVVYNENGTVNRDIHGIVNPDFVIVDTEIIVNAPPRFLSAGIADALATWLEAKACMRTNPVNFTGYHATITAYTIAKKCYTTLIKYAPLAILHAKEHTLSPAFEAVVEANTIMSTIGFESGGLASAHGFHQGIAEWEETHDRLHGEKVAIGILASLFLTNKKPAYIKEIYQFFQETDLPITLAQIGVKSYDNDYLMVAINRIYEEGFTHNEPIKYSKDNYLNALKCADQYGKNFR